MCWLVKGRRLRLRMRAGWGRGFCNSCVTNSSVTTGHESARRRRRAPVDAPRPVSERKPRNRFCRVSALGADHGNRQRGKGVGVEEAHLRPPGGSSGAAPPTYDPDAPYGRPRNAMPALPPEVVRRCFQFLPVGEQLRVSRSVPELESLIRRARWDVLLP